MNKSTDILTARELDVDKKIIIVLGDWFIDENWVVEDYHSYSSTHTGEFHYNLKYNPKAERYLNLCGAAEVLEILRCYIINNNLSSLKLVGFGSWNKSDNNIIQCLNCPKNSQNKYNSLYAIKSIHDPAHVEGTEYGNNNRKCIGNIDCKYESARLVNVTDGLDNSTNHIIRCYSSEGGNRPHLLYRIDSTLPINEIDNDVFFNKVVPNNVIAIVIEDHERGVVNEKTIKNLMNILPPASQKEPIKCYIRSKAENPKWLSSLNSKVLDIKLRIIDYQLAHHKRGQRKWEYGNQLGRFSLELLGELTGKKVIRGEGESFSKNKKIIAKKAAILLDENRAIAIDNNECYNLNDPVGPKQLVNVGRTTVFFSALIAQDLFGKIHNQTDDPFYVQCQKAMLCAFNQSKTISDKWKKNSSFGYSDFNSTLSILSGSEPNYVYYDPISIKSKSEKYNTLWRRWNDSSKELGIVNNKYTDDLGKEQKKSEFQVWRGCGILDNYICIGGPKRTAINNLITKIHNFRSEKAPQKPLNCLLLGSPGWGKSYLAHSIANFCELHFVEYSLSQMASTDDLVDCLDSICAIQNRVHKRLLILIDEINCEIGGHLALGLLLNPIWDGAFIRNGKTYSISPAVWIFASTDKIQDLHSDNTNKGSDFISRINGPLIELDHMEPKKKLNASDLFNIIRMQHINEVFGIDSNTNSTITPGNAQASRLAKRQFRTNYADYFKRPLKIKTEQVYMGVMLLERLWGPITKIDIEVLQLFHDMIPIYGFRSMEFFISQFKNTQFGIITRLNVPLYEGNEELERHIILPPDWTNISANFFDISIEKLENEKKLIRIVSSCK
jgi:hypothetical protein